MTNYTYKIKSHEFKKFSKEILYCIKFGANLMPYTLSGWIVGNLDKAILTSLDDKTSELAILAVGQSIFAISAFIFIAINSAWAPKFFDLKNSCDEISINTHRKKYIYITLGVVIMVLSCGLFVQEFYVKKNNENFLSIMILLAVIKIIDSDSIFYSNYFYFYEEVDKLSKIAVVASVLYLGLILLGGSNVGIIWLLISGILNSLVVNISYRLYVRKKNEAC
jgi:O-antigen/teichoic acid export membrane protein